jgi:hypothetical protein
MKMGAAVLRVALLGALTFAETGVSQVSSADCAYAPNGRIVSVAVQSCEVIDGRTNAEVSKYIGAYPASSEVRRLYTGALVTDERNMPWVYPSEKQAPCGKFPKDSQVKMRAYLTCCDSGRWGKCVFGGRWLGDVDGKPIPADQ